MRALSGVAVDAGADDLESLGRVSGERLSQHADRLATLISDNGQRVDAIVDSGDLPGKSLGNVVSGVEFLKTTGDLVGDGTVAVQADRGNRVRRSKAPVGKE